MHSTSIILFEKYITYVVREAKGRGLDTLFSPMPAPELIKLGKYKIVNNKPVVKVKLQDAIDKKYISSAVSNALNELIKVGFKFDTVYFDIDLSTLVSGNDPEGKPIFYVRKANTMSAPKIYYEYEYNEARVYYNKFSTDKPVLIEDILNKIVQGKKWATRNDGSGIIDTKGNVEFESLITVNRFRETVLKDIPVKFGTVKGNFYLSLYDFTINNLPREVYKNYKIISHIKSLMGGTEIVHGDSIIITAPNLLTLEGFPKVTTSNLILSLRAVTSLTSLEGLPKTTSHLSIEGALKLPSLYGAPTRSYLSVYLNHLNNIKNLAYFPETNSNAHIEILNCSKLINLKGISGAADSITLSGLPDLTSIIDLPAQFRELILTSLPNLINLKDLTSKRIKEITLYDLPRVTSLQDLPENVESLKIQDNVGIKDLTGCPDNIKILTINIDHLQSLQGLPFNVETVLLTTGNFSAYRNIYSKQELEAAMIDRINKLIKNIDKIGPNLYAIQYTNGMYTNSIDKDYIKRHSIEYNTALNKDNPGIEMDI